MFVRCLLCVGALLPLAAPSRGAENWFLPYAPDEHTLVLLHCDGQGDQEPNAAQPAEGEPSLRSFALVNGAVHNEGYFGGGVRFDGVKASLTAPLPASAAFRNNQDFTVETWLRCAKGGAICSLGQQFYLGVDLEEHRVSLACRAASNSVLPYAFTDVALKPDVWQHLAFVHRSDHSVRLYLNGLLAGTVTHSAEEDYPKVKSIHFGSHDGWRVFLKGDLDELRISTCAREYLPILPPELRREEPLRLQLDPARLPEKVNRVRVRVSGDSGELLCDRSLARDELASDLLAGADLSKGQAHAEVAFLDASGTELARLSADVRLASAMQADVPTRLATVEGACRKAAESVAPERLRAAQMLVESARQKLAARDPAAAQSRAAAAERIAQTFTSGQAGYRAAIRRTTRAGEMRPDLRVTMNWYSNNRPADAFGWAKRLGANELMSHHWYTSVDGMRLWKKAGYHTVLITHLPLEYPDWLKEHPEHAQVGYWLSDSLDGSGKALEIPLALPAGKFFRVSTRYDPRKYWKVMATAGQQATMVPDWEYDEKAQRVRVRSTGAGTQYRVYFLMEFFKSGDPLVPEFAAAALENLDKDLAAYRGVADALEFDFLSYAYPGDTPQGFFERHSYTLAARPEAQERFTRETGVAFDPQWLVTPKLRIGAVPDPRYLTWMSWVQKGLLPWLSAAAAIPAKQGMQTRLYWGDGHIGMEPYLGSLDGRIEELEREAGGAASMRGLLDFPGDVRRRFRVEWIFPETAQSDASAADFLRKWAAALRGLLIRPPSAIYWMDFQCLLSPPDLAVREDLVETMAEISDEFRLIAERLSGASAFAHPINVYVADAWGAVYSWQGPLLTHLADLPVRVQFISFADIEARGLPRDAHVLFLYGTAGTAWSGGRWWESGKVAAAVQKFVRAGGGLLALQAPSQLESPQPHWALGELLGVSRRTGAVKGEALARLPVAARHWLAAEVSGVANMENMVRVAPLPASSVLYVVPSAKDADPGVVVSQFGRGRVVYFSGASPDYAFKRLMRRAVFWAAKREADATRLDVSGAEHLFVYAYPKQHLLALLNQDRSPAKAVVRCNPQILGVKGTVQLTDVATGNKLWKGSSTELAAGVPIVGIPMCARLIQVQDTASLSQAAPSTGPNAAPAEASAQPQRTWTDASGQHRTEATFVDMAAGQVRLRKADGTVILIPLEKLSPADQEWLRRQSR